MTEPYAHGLLDVGAGHRVYWEECGNPAGRPAVVLHGGPGTGCTAAHRDLFDPALYRVVLLDQRGCGRSTPRVLDHQADLSANHTSALVGDLERLREHRLLHHPDPAVRDTAVAAWCAWEAATLSLHPDPHAAAAFADPRFAATLVRLALHYFRHHGWLEDDQLLRDAGRLRGIPGVLVAGRGDVQTPVRAAWELAHAWPDARLVIVDGAGHASTEGAVAAALRHASTTLAG